MPGIFGYFDPDQQLPGSTLDKMARVLEMDPTSHAAIERTEIGGFGIVNYAGFDRIAGDSAVSRYAVFGRLDALSPGDVFVPHADIANHCFGGEAIRDIESIRGSFVAVVHEHRNGSMTLLTDRFASQPLYLFWHGPVCYFASQLKAILAVLPERAIVDSESVASMLSMGEVIGNRTLVAGINTLPAATRLTLSRGGKRSHRYWQYLYEEDVSNNWDAAVERSGSALRTAVARCASNGGMLPSLAVPLSGGLDSRFVLDLAHQQKFQPYAYTWGTSDCRDIRYAQNVAHRLGCPHETYVFQQDYLASMADHGVWLTEGHTPATNFHVLPYVDKMVSQGHDVLLDGFAGDVVLGGNFIADAWLDSNDVNESAIALWRWRRSGFDGLWQHSGLSKTRTAAEEIFIDAYSGYPGLKPMDKVMAFLIDNRLRRTTNCGTELFRSRLFVRQPFMDADFIDVIRTLPHQWRKRHRFYLAVIKKYAPLSASAPYQRTMLPASSPFWMNWFALATQRGMVEMAKRLGLPDPYPGKSPSDFPSWFRGALRTFVETVLLSDRTLDRGVIPADAVRDAVGLHMRRERDLSSLIGAMLSVELFCRVFLDDLGSSISEFSRSPPESFRGQE